MNSTPLTLKKAAIFSCVLFNVFFCSAQVRFNEISASVQSGKKQWIEIFIASGNISDYRVLVKFKSSATDSGFYVFSLSGNPNANGYFVLGNNNGNATWQSTSLSKKISWDGSELPFSLAESNAVLTSSGTNHIFLLKGNRIVDALVTGISNTLTPISTLQLDLNAWSNFNVVNGIGLNGLSVDFRIFQLTNLNTINQVSGDNTVSFIYNNQCSTSSPWVLTPLDTRDKINSGSIAPSIDYWETDYKISSTFNRGPSDFFVIPNNTIPGGSPTFDYTNAIPTKLYFKYTLNNTSVTVNTANPSFKLYYDKGAALDLPNKVLDPADPEISLNVSASLETPNTVYVNVPVTPDMIYTDNSGIRKVRPLFPILTSANACFKSQSIVLASSLELLPINLLSFSVLGINDGIQLNWATTSEEFAKGFELERAIGSPEKFRFMSFMSTKAINGMSQSRLNYSYNDLNPEQGKINYYRIKLVDIDGASSYTEVKSIYYSQAANQPNIYPNPSNGFVSVMVKSAGKYEVYIYDNTGREIKRVECSENKFDRINGLKPGFYTIKFIDSLNGSQSFRRLVVS